jgi:hypothetical protein
MHVNQGGIYILAEINDNLRPHRDEQYQWSTQNDNANLVLMWVNYESDIVNIEGYDVNDLEEPHPRRFVLQEEGTAMTNQMTFYAHRSQEFDGGIFLTSFTDSSVVYRQELSCADGCHLCDSRYPDYCLQCDADYYLFDHQCYADSCPDYSYEVLEEDGVTSTFFCKNCHFSCRTCSGPKETQCSTCCVDNECGAIKNRIPDSGMCVCDALTQVESNGLCLSRCIKDLAGRRGDKCYT